VTDQEFINMSPHPLTALNIPGAFTTPAPPESLDISKAGPAELLRSGIHWRQPQAGDPPGVAAAGLCLRSRRSPASGTTCEG